MTQREKTFGEYCLVKSQKQTQNVVRQETCFLFLPPGVVVYVCFLYVAAYDIKSVSTTFWLVFSRSEQFAVFAVRLNFFSCFLNTKHEEKDDQEVLNDDGV